MLEAKTTNITKITVFPVVGVVNKPIWEAPFEEDPVLSCSSKFTTSNRMAETPIGTGKIS